MTISDDTGSWASLVTAASDAEVDAIIAGVKTWLMRTGGVLAVREAELVGPDMVVMCGREVHSGAICGVSVPLSEVLAAA